MDSMEYPDMPFSHQEMITMFCWPLRFRLIIALGLLLLGVVLFWSLWPGGFKVPVDSPSTPGQSTRSTGQEPEARISLVQEHRPLECLAASLAALRSVRSPQDGRSIIAALKRHLSSLPSELASATIQEFLDTHQDASTQLDFVIGPDCFLKESPSLRVFLLDYLGGLDRPAAAAYAPKVLEAMNSPDEWAISLRNIALIHTNIEVNAFIRAKVRAMITHEAWQQQPSTGFLEDFDIAVYLGGTSLMPELAGLLRQTENRAVSHAAYLALDRLVLQEPGPVLRLLEAQPELMTGRELTRANYFARANVGNSEQRQLLEAYLLNRRLTGAELEAFAGVFPNANYLVSNNLLTRTITPSHQVLAQQDRQALKVVESWLGDSRFARVKPQLERVRYRLADFVSQAGGSP
jgi:hypothetical protein